MVLSELTEADPKIDAYIEELSGFKTQFDIFRFMKRVTETFGSRAFMVLNLPSDTSLELSTNSVITNWPAEMLSLYDREGLLSTSPVLARLRRSSAPFPYDIETQHAHNRELDQHEYVVSLFTRYRMQRGAYFPVHDSAGNRGAISLSGDRPAFSSSEMQMLFYLFIHVADRLAEIRKQDVRTSDALTAREIDCLIWTAAGKTSIEIAEILKLSEHTVNHYLNRAAKKLDTVNRTQAVVKALRLGLIK